jgi:sarcosine oxidase subunit alpha
MPEDIALTVNGKAIRVPPGTVVAAAVGLAGESRFRVSVSGEPRGPLCGMGICFECRLTIDGVRHQRSCQIFCRAKMKVETDAG